MRRTGWTVWVVLAACTQTPRAVDGMPAWPVVRGSLGGAPILWHVAFSHGAGVLLCPLEEAEPPSCRSLDGLTSSELGAMDAGAWSPNSTFFLSQRLEGTVPRALLADSRYVAQRLVGSRAPRKWEWGYERTVGALVESLPATGYAAWAAANRGDDALYERFSHHVPVGECSADATPQNTARLFAELALARKDWPTFVDLQLRLMADQFERAAWSNFAEARNPTGAAQLLESPVDVDRLLMGLVTQDPGSEVALDAWRLARAIREAGRAETLLPKLEALAVLPQLDAYNRFRATEVWLHLQLGADPSAAQIEEVKARGRLLALHPLSRARLEATR